MNTCSDSLSAMPGDKIWWRGVDEIDQASTVKIAGWQPAPKGGKIWTYETIEGELVSNNQVLKVEKAVLNNAPNFAEQSEKAFSMGGSIQEVQMMPSEVFLHQELLQIAESLNLAPSYRVVISCILSGDVDSIEVAAKLLNIRAKQLRELENCNGFGPNVENTPNNILKEDTK